MEDWGYLPILNLCWESVNTPFYTIPLKMAHQLLLYDSLWCIARNRNNWNRKITCRTVRVTLLVELSGKNPQPNILFMTSDRGSAMTSFMEFIGGRQSLHLLFGLNLYNYIKNENPHISKLVLTVLFHSKCNSLFGVYMFFVATFDFPLQQRHFLQHD